MAIKRYKPEQIVTLLRQIEVGIANGKPTPQGLQRGEITGQTYYGWRKEYGGLKWELAKRMKELEEENARLKRLMAELSLEKQVWKDVARPQILDRGERKHDQGNSNQTGQGLLASSHTRLVLTLNIRR